jgi:hypothetical protein
MITAMPIQRHKNVALKFGKKLDKFEASSWGAVGSSIHRDLFTLLLTAILIEFDTVTGNLSIICV